MMEQFGGRGGRGGGGGGAGGGGAASGHRRALSRPPLDRPTRSTSSSCRRRSGSGTGPCGRGTRPPRSSTETRVVVGLADNQFSQLLSGDVKPGQQVVTSIIVPLTTRSATRRTRSSAAGAATSAACSPAEAATAVASNSSSNAAGAAEPRLRQPRRRWPRRRFRHQRERRGQSCEDIAFDAGQRGEPAVSGTSGVHLQRGGKSGQTARMQARRA